MMQMAHIVDCDVEKCAYNQKKKCHALAINVGSDSAVCEAFVVSDVKCGGSDMDGGVGACKMKDCKFNECLMCGAEGVDIQWHGSHALCSTYSAR